MSNSPLAGLRVLDFSWVWSGPLVATMLAEFGADVIKVEHGKRLDNSRLRGRPTVKGRTIEGSSIELSPYFHQTNHDKRSITVNLKDARGIALLHRLVEQSDIIVENLTPGALSRVGLGYERLSGINPRIIMISMSAVGQSGPMSDMRAYAPIMSSFCGLETAIGYAGEPPLGMMNFGYGDPNAAIHSLLPLLGAVYARETSGQGCHIDVSQLEALLAVLPEPITDWTLNSREPTTNGARHKKLCPHGIFRAKGSNRWLSIAVLDDESWEKLVGLAGNPGPLQDPRFLQVENRLAAIDLIEDELSKWTVTQERDTLVERLRNNGIASSPVNSIEEQWDDPQFLHRGVRRPVEHPLFGAEKLYATPWTMSETPPQVTKSAPVLGTDNAYVFGTLLKLSNEEIQALEKEGVIA
jgi:crotonobetainyl-CoA:carnitine CoA-transferase CaiB-like acyl-CoA transferase